ncbi:hypothetical protein RFI_24437 [Reticulomyxa filosa]|uniref:Uncharacterized protein n=1 Tax=Reticulomyxa filosa TaxID=46433 RepID=X6MGD9_RETFI|nr:hypothetical protein RFI_24437 [Reticulomyxa filosa]|eukprot:ETO12939.1 hypothetical protein RFI_24437 [Reticulomyxa filosa]
MCISVYSCEKEIKHLQKKAKETCLLVVKHEKISKWRFLIFIGFAGVVGAVLGGITGLSCGVPGVIAGVGVGLVIGIGVGTLACLKKERDETGVNSMIAECTKKYSRLDENMMANDNFFENIEQKITQGNAGFIKQLKQSLDKSDEIEEKDTNEREKKISNQFSYFQNKRFFKLATSRIKEVNTDIKRINKEINNIWKICLKG